MKTLLLSFLLINTAFALPELDSLEVSTNSCSENCIELSEVINRVKTHNLETLESALSLYKARENVTLKVGNLIPQLKLQIITEPWGLLETIPHLLGFLFPSNWFSWKESKLFAKAQQYSYLNFLANQVQTAQNLYYNAHLIASVESTQQKQLQFLKELFKVLEQRELDGNVAYEDLELAKSKLYQKEIDLTFTSQAKNEAIFELAELMNLQGPWRPLEISTLSLKVPQNEYPLTDIKEEILKKSYQNKAIDYLLLASQYAKKVRTWSFLVPDSEGPGLGYGLAGSIRLGRAEVEEVKLKKQKFELALTKTLHILSSQLENISEVYEKASFGEEAIFNVLSTLREDFLITGAMDFNDFFEGLESLFGLQYAKLLSMHSYLEVLSKKDRLLRSIPEYRDLKSYLPEKRDHRFKFLSPEWRENKRIEKDIRRGVLTLD